MYYNFELLRYHDSFYYYELFESFIGFMFTNDKDGDNFSKKTKQYSIKKDEKELKK